MRFTARQPLAALALNPNLFFPSPSCPPAPVMPAKAGIHFYFFHKNRASSLFMSLNGFPLKAGMTIGVGFIQIGVGLGGGLGFLARGFLFLGFFLLGGVEILGEKHGGPLGLSF